MGPAGPHGPFRANWRWGRILARSGGSLGVQCLVALLSNVLSQIQSYLGHLWASKSRPAACLQSQEPRGVGHPEIAINALRLSEFLAPWFLIHEQSKPEGFLLRF